MMKTACHNLFFALGLLIATQAAAGSLDTLTLETADVRGAVNNDLCQSKSFKDRLKTFNEPGIQAFRESVCVFHDVIDDVNPSGDGKALQAQYDRLQTAVTVLRLAQDTNIPARHQTLAAFMEAQVHCRISDLYKTSASQLLSQQRFCTARRAAYAAINDLDWRFVSFDYPQADAAKYPLHFSRLSSCQGEGGVLSASYDSVCGLTKSVTESEMVSVIDTEVMPQLKTKYFEGAQAPITAIFSRKETIASAVKTSAEAEKGNLKDDSAAIAGAYDDYNRHYLNEIKSRVDPIVENYQASAEISKRILALYKRWSEGLLYDGTRNYALDLVGPNPNAPADQKAGKEGDMVKLMGTFEKSDEGSFVKKNAVQEGVARLRNRKQLAETRALNLCKAYYCAVAANDSLGGGSSYDLACSGSLYNVNPLCEVNVSNKKMKISFAGANREMSAQEFCTQPSVGMHPADAKVNAMLGCPFVR